MSVDRFEIATIAEAVSPRARMLRRSPFASRVKTISAIAIALPSVLAFGALAFGALAFGALGCGAPRVQRPPVDELTYGSQVRALPIPSIPDFVLRQQVEAHHAAGVQRFEAVVQKQGDTLVVIGLGPASVRAFQLVQQGTNVTYKQLLPFELPFPPEAILVDIHRALLWGSGAPAAPHHDPVLAADPTERVTERRQGGHVVERAFHHRDAPSSAPIHLRFTGSWPPDALVSTHTTLENPWYGYRLEIETLEQQRLPAGSTPAAPAGPSASATATTPGP